MTVSSDSVRDLNSASTVTFPNVVSGPGGLTKSGGTGTLTLSGTNTFGGTGKSVTLAAGTLNLGNASALGDPNNTLVLNGGTLNNTSGAAMSTPNYAQTWGGDFTFTGTSDLNLGTGAVSMTASRLITVNGSNLTVGGPISGTGFTLTKAGAGMLTLSGANSFASVPAVNGGTLLATSKASLPGWSTPGMTVAAGATAAIRGGAGATEWSQADIDTFVAATSFSANANLGIEVATGNTFTYGSVISGAKGFVKLGDGKLTLTNTNTYTGTDGTVVRGGTLSVADIQNSGVNSPLGAGNIITLNGVSSAAPGILQLTGSGTFSTDRQVSIPINTYGAIDLPGGAWLTLNGQVSSASTVNGLDVRGISTSKLTLSGAADNASVLLSVSGGTVDLGKASTSAVHAVAGITNIGPGATVRLTGTGGDQIWQGAAGASDYRGQVNMTGGVFDLYGNSESFDRLTGTTGTVTNTNPVAAVSNLTLGQVNGSGQFDGVIQNGGPGTVSLTKMGTGTLTLTGVNTYTGTTTVNGGTLALAGAAGKLASAVAVNPGGTFLDGDTVNAGVANRLSSTLVLTMNGGTFSMAFPLTGDNNQTLASLNLAAGMTNTINTTGTAGGTVNLTFGTYARTAGTLINFVPGTATFKFTGAPAGTLAGAVLNGSALAAVCAGGVVTLATYTTAWGTGLNTDVVVSGPAGGPLTGSLRFDQPPTTILTLLGTTTLDAGSILVTPNAVGGAVITGSTLRGSAGASGELLSYNNNPLLIDSAITDNGGATALTKAGASTLVLMGDNTYTGVTTIGAGTVQVGGYGSHGSVSSAVLANDGTLNFAVSHATTINGAVSGNGTINNLGLGTVTLNGPINGNLTRGGVGPMVINGAVNGALTITGGGGMTQLGSAATLNGPVTITGESQLGLAAVDQFKPGSSLTFGTTNWGRIYLYGFNQSMGPLSGVNALLANTHTEVGYGNSIWTTDSGTSDTTYSGYIRDSSSNPALPTQGTLGLTKPAPATSRSAAPISATPARRSSAPARSPSPASPISAALSPTTGRFRSMPPTSSRRSAARVR